MRDMGRPQSQYRLTVPESLWLATYDACGPDFADSYLYGASLVGSALTPRTLTAFRRMRETRDFTNLLKELGINLVQPPPFHLSGNPHSAKDPY